jgi:hypothetical protein
MRVLVLGLAVALLAGCGAPDHETLGGCLDKAGFLVTASDRAVNGTSPAGVAFTLTTYGNATAANRAAMKLDPRTTAVVATSLVDFHGNPDPSARLSKDDLATIRRCLEKTTG